MMPCSNAAARASRKAGFGAPPREMEMTSTSLSMACSTAAMISMSTSSGAATGFVQVVVKLLLSHLANQMCFLMQALIFSHSLNSLLVFIRGSPLLNFWYNIFSETCIRLLIHFDKI